MTRQHCLLVFSWFSMCVYKKCKNIFIFFVRRFRKQYIIIIFNFNYYLMSSNSYSDMWRVFMYEILNTSSQ